MVVASQDEMHLRGRRAIPPRDILLLREEFACDEDDDRVFVFFRGGRAHRREGQVLEGRRFGGPADGGRRRSGRGRGRQHDGRGRRRRRR